MNTITVDLSLIKHEIAESIRLKLIDYCQSKIDDLANKQMPNAIKNAPNSKKEMQRRQIRGRIFELKKLKTTLEQGGSKWLVGDND